MELIFTCFQLCWKSHSTSLSLGGISEGKRDPWIGFEKPGGEDVADKKRGGSYRIGMYLSELTMKHFLALDMFIEWPSHHGTAIDARI